MRPANGCSLARLGFRRTLFRPKSSSACRQLLPGVRGRQVTHRVGQQFVDQALGQGLGVVHEDELAALLRFPVRDEADGRDRELCEVGVPDRCAALLPVDQPRRLLDRRASDSSTGMTSSPMRARSRRCRPARLPRSSPARRTRATTALGSIAPSDSRYRRIALMWLRTSGRW